LFRILITGGIIKKAVVGNCGNTAEMASVMGQMGQGRNDKGFLPWSRVAMNYNKQCTEEVL